MYEDHILYNGVSYSISTLYELIDLLDQEKSLRNKPEKKKEYDELVAYIDEYVLSCATMVTIYRDLFELSVNAFQRKE